MARPTHRYTIRAQHPNAQLDKRPLVIITFDEGTAETQKARLIAMGFTAIEVAVEAIT